MATPQDFALYNRKEASPMPKTLLRLKRLFFVPEFEDPPVEESEDPFVDVKIDSARLFGFMVSVVRDGDDVLIANLAFVPHAVQPVAEIEPVVPAEPGSPLPEEDIQYFLQAMEVPYLLNATEFWLLAFLMDHRTAWRLLHHAAPADRDALIKGFGADFEPDLMEDGRDLAWLADGIAARGLEWLRAERALLERVNDGIVCATDGERTLLDDDGELTPSALIALQAVVVRIRSQASLLGRLLSALADEQSDDRAPSSSVRSRRAASVAA
jgi:hypothetical protein